MSAVTMTAEGEVARRGTSSRARHEVGEVAVRLATWTGPTEATETAAGARLPKTTGEAEVASTTGE